MVSDAQQAWTLLQQFASAHSRHTDLAEALGFSLGDGRGKVLFQLRGGARTLTEIAAAAAVDAPYATLIVDKLEALGLVERQPHPADRRRKLVSLTPSGCDAIAMADRILERPPAALALLAAEDRATLLGLLQHLTELDASGGRNALVPHTVDFATVSTAGLESSPVEQALAGLRANEARYYKNKFDHDFTVEAAADAPEVVAYVSRLLKEERDIVIASPPLEATTFEVDGMRMSYVFYESGLAINVMYTLANGGKRAVGFKLSDGMEIPAELETRFKFARQKSKLAGTIRGSFFVIKGAY